MDSLEELEAERAHHQRVAQLETVAELARDVVDTTAESPRLVERMGRLSAALRDLDGGA